MYVDKYRCETCMASYWTLANPMVCPKCGGNTDIVEDGVESTDTPSALFKESAVKRDVTVFLQEFDEWWEKEDA